MTRSWPFVALATASQRTLRTPSTIVVTIALYVVVAGTMTALWRVAANGNGGAIGGYTAAQLTWYLATSEAVTVCLNSRMIERIGDEIADGSVAVEMLRPASMLGMRLCTELGACLPRLGACALAGFVLATITTDSGPSATALLLTVPALLLAVACNLVGQHAVAAAAFWLRDAHSTWFLYQKLVFILGGMLIPLELLPSALRTVCFVLPFAAMAYVPARLASGHVEPWLLALQLGWLAVLAIGAIAAFRAGQRRLEVVGG
jgi:ABC-2 type transport system permease protein